MPRAAGLGPHLESGYARHVRVSALRVRAVERAPATLSHDQQLAMINGAVTARDLFLVRLLLDSGLRVGEALGLCWQDIHFLPDSSALGCPLAGAHLETSNANATYSTQNFSRRKVAWRSPRSAPCSWLRNSTLRGRLFVG